MANVTLENGLKGIASGATAVTSKANLANKYILLFDSSGNVVGKVKATNIIDWSGGGSSSSTSSSST